MKFDNYILNVNNLKVTKIKDKEHFINFEINRNFIDLYITFNKEEEVNDFLSKLEKNQYHGIKDTMCS